MTGIFAASLSLVGLNWLFTILPATAFVAGKLLPAVLLPEVVD